MRRETKTIKLNDKRVRIENYINGQLVSSIETDAHPYKVASSLGLVIQEADPEATSILCDRRSGRKGLYLIKG